MPGSVNSEGLWETLARLDDSRAVADQRDAEKGILVRRESDVEEVECRLPLRILQEISGRPIGFETL
ncbi:MAG: hypothetical protein JO029_10115 [Candidatus Eremiobacteraeota bacterium]|nr:hypothetical protein [Candidatus Eremiobacteraeota bacterium]MBV8723508.1 hypothetical protein [Candidatus Eremiobacteraeota bacterium]